MNVITNKTFDEERALYGAQQLMVADCKFDGPSDGESAFKEGRGLTVRRCFFDTKDAFWHAKNIMVRNSVVKGEYLAWYSENITFENCKIIGTQPTAVS